MGLVAVALIITSCGDDDAAEPATFQQEETVTSVEDDGVTSVETQQLGDQLMQLPIEVLSPADAEGLIFIREEEKLAGDVYQALFDTWGLPIFENIQEAEQTHTLAVKNLLDRYDLDDPAAGAGPGEFQNKTIQALYDDLVARGRQSLLEALTVGALIEELDISDLQARASTSPDIDLVYDNLEKGSRNHLRAFSKQLDRNDATYEPVYLDQDAYDAIVDSPTERGRNA